MKKSISRPEALELLERHLKTDYLRLHSRESEVIMQAMAKKLGGDEDFWGICGLLHDLDLDEINGNMNRHGSRTVDILKNEGYDIPELFQAIMAHVEGFGDHGYKRISQLDFILSGAETLTGLISAYVILRPGGKIEGLKTKSIMKKFKSPAFAAKVDRDLIREAADHANMELNEFITLSIDAMSSIADELGM
ncbi:MAG: HD domain-containing protein [Candidatus Neomarinimicrobiota bacterium]